MSAPIPSAVAYGRHPVVERWLFLYVPLCFALVFLVGPFYWMLITALKSDSELYDGTKSPFYVARPTLDHFVYLLTKTDFITWLGNTMMVASLLLTSPRNVSLMISRVFSSTALFDALSASERASNAILI